MKFLHPSPKSSSRGITILRVAFGAMLLVHGVQKFTAGHAAFAASVAAMGVQKPDIIAWLVIAGELGLGLLLVLGALTRVVSAAGSLSRAPLSRGPLRGGPPSGRPPSGGAPGAGGQTSSSCRPRRSTARCGS